MHRTDGERQHESGGVSRMNLTDRERLASALAGASMLAFGLARRRVSGAGKAGAVAGSLGAGLLLRGVSGRCPVYAAAHVNHRHTGTREALGGMRGLHVKEAIVVDRPVDEIYWLWRQLDRLPELMSHLKSVTVLNDRRSHWVVRAPAGHTVEWDAEIIHDEPNRVIGWRSLPASEVATAGSVTFRPASGGRGTELTVHLQYDPPAGRAGAAFAWLFGEEPSQQIRDDLRRFRDLIDSSAIPIDGPPFDRDPLATDRPGL